MSPSTTRFAAEGKRKAAQVIPFPPETARRTRRTISDAGEALGQILLYTGIRYERMVDPAPEAAASQRRHS